MEKTRRHPAGFRHLTMNKPYRIVSRGSALALAQVERFIEGVLSVEKDADFEIELIESAGDRDRKTPLPDITQTDFFTREVQEALFSTKADFAVHSLKDVCDPHFFDKSAIAYIDRDDPRDVLFLHPSFSEKIGAGIPLKIGTCSPRRALTAGKHLADLLPHCNGFKAQINVAHLRGNVDARLKQLSQGHYDGIILAAAGINRLLAYKPSTALLSERLSGLRWMHLPLVECTPAPCQATIVAECDVQNVNAVKVLQKLHKKELEAGIQLEKKLEQTLRPHPKAAFGTASFLINGVLSAIASGEDVSGRFFSQWTFPQPPAVPSETIFSATDVMKHFFRAESLPLDSTALEEAVAVFVTHHHVLNHLQTPGILNGKRIWVSGTKTWRHLAEKGFFVEGSADGFGLESLHRVFVSPTVQLDETELLVLTSTTGAAHWSAKGRKCLALYKNHPSDNSELATALHGKTFFFWTNKEQYLQVKHLIPENATHAVPAGQTAQRFKEAGIEAVVFPTIGAFQQWRKNLV